MFFFLPFLTFCSTVFTSNTLHPPVKTWEHQKSVISEQELYEQFNHLPNWAPSTAK
jgi:hypothetical protein